MDHIFARLFLDYSRDTKALTFVYEWDTMTGISFDVTASRGHKGLPIPFPTEVPEPNLYSWFKDIVIKWLVDTFWSPTLDIPETDFQLLFCHYLKSCDKPSP